jgi:small GTP-binding protein
MGTGGGLVLEGPIAELRERELRLLSDMSEHVGAMGPEGANDRQRLLDTASDLREMFLMVVVIGEFNSGKSTFVNALLGDPLLPMGITPTTDMIELVRHKPVATHRPTVRDDAVREWGHPNTGMPGIVIVDTPGTGSIFQKHEQIAKSFLHRSDLVIFVISAKRAFAETERLYLELAKNFGKKIIVVVNQSDLLSAKEQGEVKAFVQQQIDELLNLRPPIFMVSARKALQGEKSGGLLSGFVGGQGKDDFGMNAVRNYLRQTFEQVPPAKQKLLAPLELLRNIASRYRQQIQNKLMIIGNDTNAAENLQHEMEQQAASLDRQLESTLKEMHGVFESVRRRGQAYIDKHINVIRAVRGGIDREALRKEFDTEVLGKALDQIGSISEHYANATVDGGRAYWRSVIERLNKMEALLREEAANMDAATYADQRAALQAAMTMADVEMKGYTDNTVIEGLQANFEQNVRSFTYSAVGGLGGAIAALLSILTPGALALHPLAALGFAIGAPVMILGGGAAYIFWRKAVNDARNELDKSIQDLEDSYKKSMVELTTRERNRLLQYGKQILAPVFSQLQTLARRYKEQQAQLDAFVDRAKGLETEINAVDLSKKEKQRA